MKNKETPLWKIHAHGNLIHLPFWRRIRHLLLHPSLSKKPVGMYLLGKEKYIEGPSMKPLTYPINWVLQPGRPGHVDGNLMKKILEKNSREKNFPKKEGIIGFWDDNRDWLTHSAVFSEFTDGRTVVFHQKNVGEEFGVSSVENYLDNHPKQIERYYSFIG
jgi:hypothetical protein